ncbi:cell wall-binding repeat-containing protein [Candidatus Clostridium radicumherbarum]|uniref:Cell wall-binding repeat-containing protein n=1 Tax=Candidatus Clostridium radicumherbarum TaxID=3381662 RepID=A0ABW8TWF0_9CLOT
MKRGNKLIAAAISCLILNSMVSEVKVLAADSSQYTRLFGADRYHTAIAVAKANWTTSDYAVIARGDDFADALCAGPLAKAYNAPILLTAPSKLDPDVVTLLNNLKVKTVFIVGGTGAVSDNVKKQITDLNIDVNRISGSDRYGTSEKVAEELKSKIGSITKVAVATGLDFPDALSISPIASNLSMPILLTNTNSMPSQISQFLSANSITQSYVVGGAGVVSDAVKNKLPSPIRLGGADRYATNAAVLNQFDSVLNYNNIYVTVADGTSNDEFADALSGSVAAAKTASPMILVYKSLPDIIGNFIYPRLMGNTKVIALGGTAVVPQSIVDLLVSKAAAPVLKSIALKDTASNVTINAVIKEPSANSSIGTVQFTIPSSLQKFDTGSAVLSEDLSSASLISPNINKTVSNIKVSDDFGQLIFNAVTSAGYNPADGILASNIQTLLNGSVLTLTDKSGGVKKYTIVITIK